MSEYWDTCPYCENDFKAHMLTCNACARSGCQNCLTLEDHVYICDECMKEEQQDDEG